MTLPLLTGDAVERRKLSLSVGSERISGIPRSTSELIRLDSTLGLPNTCSKLLRTPRMIVGEVGVTGSSRFGSEGCINGSRLDLV